MAAIDVARSLSFWKGKVEPKPIKGGITNANFLVEDAGQRYFVRVGEDIPIHGVMRFNESAASRAAAACGLSPELLHQAPGALVFRFIEAKTLGAEDVRPRAMLERILPLLRTCHREMPKHVRGPALIFWVFHVVRDYAHTLKEGNSRHLQDLPALMRMADELEHAVGPVDIVFGHNDLLAQQLPRRRQEALADRLGLCRLQLALVRPLQPRLQQRGLGAGRALAARKLFREAADARAVAQLPRHEVRIPAARDHVEHGAGDPLRARFRLPRLHRRLSRPAGSDVRGVQGEAQLDTFS